MRMIPSASCPLRARGGGRREEEPFGLPADDSVSAWLDTKAGIYILSYILYIIY
jgi:hypothetical protein